MFTSLPVSRERTWTSPVSGEVIKLISFEEHMGLDILMGPSLEKSAQISFQQLLGSGPRGPSEVFRLGKLSFSAHQNAH